MSSALEKDKISENKNQPIKQQKTINDIQAHLYAMQNPAKLKSDISESVDLSEISQAKKKVT